MAGSGAPPPLTRETLRLLAERQGLVLSEGDLDAVLPLVQSTRALLDELTDAPLGDVEPTVFYRTG